MSLGLTEQSSSPLTLSVEVSPARTYHTLDGEPDSTELEADYSSSLCGSFARFDPDTLSWRTFQASLLGGLTEFSDRWPYAGTMRNGIVSARPASGRSIDVIASSSWPTPSAQEPGWKNIEVVDKNGNPPEHPNQRFYDKSSGRLVQKGLAQVVRMWPTPKCQNANSPAIHGQGGMDLQTTVMFPSPRGSEGGVGLCGGTGSRQILDRLNEAGEITDSERLAMQAGNGGQLNPTWVEWLMGFPPGWTDLGLSEMPSCPRSESTSDDVLSNTKGVI